MANARRAGADWHEDLARGLLRIFVARIDGNPNLPLPDASAVWKQAAGQLGKLPDVEVKDWWQRHGHDLCRATGRAYQACPPEPDTEGGGP